MMNEKELFHCSCWLAHRCREVHSTRKSQKPSRCRRCRIRRGSECEQSRNASGVLKEVIFYVISMPTCRRYDVHRNADDSFNKSNLPTNTQCETLITPIIPFFFHTDKNVNVASRRAIDGTHSGGTTDTTATNSSIVYLCMSEFKCNNTTFYHKHQFD